MVVFYQVSATNNAFPSKGNGFSFNSFLIFVKKMTFNKTVSIFCRKRTLGQLVFFREIRIEKKQKEGDI